jgi:hypothetical protein
VMYKRLGTLGRRLIARGASSRQPRAAAAPMARWRVGEQEAEWVVM